ncbi:MAG: radical SAM protein [Candidatus Rokubacteria bacterium]|nr:radical SAM protein [Candidatus Rokubacteria bacterium]
MDRHQRLTILAEAATADRERGLPKGPAGPGDPIGITRVRLPGGGSTRIMRVMQTNACSLSCGYCPTFCGGKVKRTALAPEEVATTFMEAHRAGLAQGLFLTSGVPGKPVRAMDRMLAAVEVLRCKEGYRGYVHIKLLPGADSAQVEQAARLANRVSINLEAPGDGFVRGLAKEKDFSGDLLPKLELAGRLLRDARWNGSPGGLRAAGTTTQFVVGPSGETDREILSLVARLEREELLHHAHFSAFQPVVGTPMEGGTATPAMREFRLYQAEHLLRQYGFRFDELPFDADGNLPLDVDPKTAWALRQAGQFPLEVRAAPYELLLRVPGVGPKAALTLVQQRRRSIIRGAEDLRRVGVDTVRAGYFLALHGRRLAPGLPAHQFRLFPHGQHLTQAPWKTVVPPCAFR